MIRAQVADPAGDGLVGDDTWLELAVTCDPEAVEAVSEILSRVAPGGVSVEPGFRLTDEGLGAVADPSRPATVRAYLPARPAGRPRGGRHGRPSAGASRGLRPARDRRARHDRCP